MDIDRQGKEVMDRVSEKLLTNSSPFHLMFFLKVHSYECNLLSVGCFYLAYKQGDRKHVRLLALLIAVIS